MVIILGWKLLKAVTVGMCCSLCWHFSKLHLKCLDHFHPSLVSRGHQESELPPCHFSFRAVEGNESGRWPVQPCGHMTRYRTALASQHARLLVFRTREFLSIVAWFYIFQKQKPSFCCHFPNPPFTQYLPQYLLSGQSYGPDATYPKCIPASDS